MLEKNMLMPLPSRKKRIIVLLKIMYFFSGFTLAMCFGISNFRTLNIDTRRNIIGVMDLLERRENRFNKDSSGRYIFNGVDI
ncbi:MAG: hypothetical protein Q8O30_00260 [Candidatus Omnitrophota bacterium]|nr:hypothetical protein [Candidatus Omnitrophota bacterium]